MAVITEATCQEVFRYVTPRLKEFHEQTRWHYFKKNHSLCLFSITTLKGGFSLGHVVLDLKEILLFIILQKF